MTGTQDLTDIVAEQARILSLGGQYPPTLMIIPGSLILVHRPDLVGTIDPVQLYRVTADVVAPQEV